MNINFEEIKGKVIENKKKIITVALAVLGVAGAVTLGYVLVKKGSGGSVSIPEGLLESVPTEGVSEVVESVTEVVTEI